MIARAIITALVLTGVYAAALSRFPASVSRKGATVHQSNIVLAEEVIHARRHPPNLLVGSSLTARLAPEMLGPEFASLAIQGGSAQTGLEIIRRSHLPVRRAFVEANLLFLPPDAEVLDYLYSYPMGALRDRLPFLRQSGQPVNLLLSLVQKNKSSVSFAYNQEQFSFAIDHWRKIWADELPPGQAARLEAAKTAIDALAASGVEVILVEYPHDPAVLSLPYAKSVRALVQGRFPEGQYHWLRGDPQRAYQTTDGLHLSTESAKVFAAQIRGAAERTAEGKHEVADFDAVGLAEGDRGEMRGCNPEHGKIVVVGMHQDRRLEPAAVGKRDADGLSAIDDVIAGHDQAEIGIDDDARADNA